MAQEKNSEASVETETEIDVLFTLPLEEFTAARNALSTRLRKAGQRHEAERVKALPKPSVTAWAVNQLFWKHRNALFELISAGERVLAAQTSQLSGKSVDIREPLEARREVLSRLLRLAAAVLDEGGHNPSPDKMRRLTATLEAISARGMNPDAQPDGRLTDDIDAPGFELFTTLMPAGSQIKPMPAPPATKEARGTPDSTHGENRAAQRDLENAERSLAEARARAQDTEAELQAAIAQAKETEQLLREAQKRFEQVRAEDQEARQRVSLRAAEMEKAAKS